MNGEGEMYRTPHHLTHGGQVVEAAPARSNQLPADEFEHLAQGGLWREAQMAFDNRAFVTIVKVVYSLSTIWRKRAMWVSLFFQAM